MGTYLGAGSRGNSVKIADRMEQNLELLATAETWETANPFAKPVLPTCRWRLTISLFRLVYSGAGRWDQ